MKFGISSYSLYQAMQRGEMSFLEAIGWAKEMGAEHFEVVPLGFDLVQDSSMVREIRTKAKEEGIELSNYAIGANFLKQNVEEVNLEIKRVKKHVDIAHELGVQFMRHDLASRPPSEATISKFSEDLHLLTEVCREIADYALQYGIVTSIENHGFYIQSSDRVQLLVNKVGRSNFRTTLDIGNFLCTDEDPVSAVKNNIPLASVVHVKDFYYRPSNQDPGEGWFKTKSGNFLRGAITGHGDLDVRQILKVIKNSGYDGYLSLEFEGLEECRFGTRVGFENLRRIWQSV